MGKNILFMVLIFSAFFLASLSFASSLAPPMRCSSDSDCKLLYSGCGCEAVDIKDNRTFLVGPTCIVNSCHAKNVSAICVNDKCERSDELNCENYSYSNCPRVHCLRKSGGTAKEVCITPMKGVLSVDMCGDGICQEVSCMGPGCAAPESHESCPEDCKNETRSYGENDCEEDSDCKIISNRGCCSAVPITDRRSKLGEGEECFFNDCAAKSGEQAVARCEKERCVISIEKSWGKAHKCEEDSDCKIIRNTGCCEAVLKTDKRSKLDDNENCFVNSCAVKSGEIVLAVCDEGRCSISKKDITKLKILPETASERARERLGELGFVITLKEVGNKAVYEVSGEKEGKMLGLFKIKGRVSAEVDAESGEVTRIRKPWWSFLASGI